MNTPELPALPDLQRFCAIDDIRAYLLKPWRLDGWVYATNGHICIRIPDNGAPDTPDYIPGKHPKAHDLFTKYFADGDEFKPMPSLPAAQTCTHCKGIGAYPAKPCAACNGEGSFMWHGMEYDCKSCDSDDIEAGWVITDVDGGPLTEGTTLKVCNHCWGRKMKMCKHPLGDAEYELAYLHWLAELPGVTYRTNGATLAAAFNFDGGQALLMPRHR